MPSSLESRILNVEQKVQSLDKQRQCLFSSATQELFARIWRKRNGDLSKIRFAWKQSNSLGDRVYIRKGPFLIKLAEEKGHIIPKLYVLDPPDCNVLNSDDSIYPTIEGKTIDVTGKQGAWYRCVDVLCQGELRIEVADCEGKETKLDRACAISLEYAVERGFTKELLPSE